MQSRILTVLGVTLAVASAGTGAFLAGRQQRQSPVEQVWQTSGGAMGGSPFGARGMGMRGARGTGQVDANAKYVFQLLRLTTGVQRLDATSASPLSAEQARAMLAVLEPLRDLPRLTGEDARQTIYALRRILTIEQRTLIAEQGPRRSRASSAMPGGMRRSGPRDAGGPRLANPFARRAEGDDSGRPDPTARLFTFLTERAAGK